jgi:hypothetical protein
VREEAEALAALTLVESLVLALEERGLLSAMDVEEIYAAAIAAHRGAAAAAGRHEAAARILERGQVRANGLRPR